MMKMKEKNVQEEQEIRKAELQEMMVKLRREVKESEQEEYLYSYAG